MFNEGNQIHNLISSSGSGTVINYGSGSGSYFLTSYGSGYGSGSTSQKVTVPTVPVPVPQHWRMDQIAENLHYIFQHGRHPCPQQQEDAGLAQEEPHRGVQEGDLGSQLLLLQPCGLFCAGRL
jgi:hypothetical protein